MVIAPAAPSTRIATSSSTLAAYRAIRAAVARATISTTTTTTVASRGAAFSGEDGTWAERENARAMAAMATTTTGEEDKARVKALFAALLTARRVKSDAEALEVAPGVFVGGVGAAKNREGLLSHGVTHVLTVCHGISAFYADDFTYGYARVADNASADIAAHFDYCYAFIADALARGGRVFVHCFQGKSRSAAVCAMYLMRSEGLSADDALARVRAVRSVAAPNSGFVAALKALEARLRAHDSEDDAEASPKKKTKRATSIATASSS